MSDYEKRFQTNCVHLENFIWGIGKIVTEEEKMRWFLLRASTVVGDRVQHLDDNLEDQFFTALESLFFKKEDPLETADEEFEGIFRLVIGKLDRNV